MERSPFRRFGKLSKYLVWIFIVVAGQNIKLVTAQSPSEKVELRPVEIQLLRDSLVGNQNLSENELEDFKVNVENKINEFQNDLTIIASKEVVEADRCLAIETALKLFIANAQMQVSNVKGGSKFYPIKKYLYRLKSLPFTRVEIKFYDLAYISKFYKGTDGKYHATATIFQEFTAYNKENVVYHDKTVKTIEIILEHGEDEFFKTKRWIVKLGDIKVVETKA